MDDSTFWHYRQGRAFKRCAALALRMARECAADGALAQHSILAWPFARPGAGGATLGASFDIGGNRHYPGQWCERPPFRFLGPVHDIPTPMTMRGRIVDHKGWFLDSINQDETVHGGVYQMTGRDGQARYIPAVCDPFNDGPAILLLDDIETARGDDHESAILDAGRTADTAAEKYAESEREYHAAYYAGHAAGVYLAQAREARAEFLEIRAELKTEPGPRKPIVAEALQSLMCRALATWRVGKKRAAALADGRGDLGDEWGPLAFDANDESLTDRFREGMESGVAR